MKRSSQREARARANVAARLPVGPLRHLFAVPARRLCVLPDRPQKTCTAFSPLDHKENTMLQKILATLLLLGAIAGCNTMNGFGQDVERGGEKIQEKATR